MILTSAAAFLCKLSLAFFTIGTNDIHTWETFHVRYETAGVETLYRDGVHVPGPTPHWQPMNHPPFAITLLRIWGTSESITGLPLRFWLRATAALADLACIVVLRRLFPHRRYLPALVAFSVAPGVIFISGYHGNTDTMMIAAVLSAVYFATIGAPGKAGFAFALATCIKILPVFLLPAFLLFFPDWRKRVRFLAVCTVAVFALSMPYFWEAPVTIVKALISYRSVVGVWGLSRLLGGGYSAYGLPILCIGVGVITWRCHRAKAPLAVTCGAVLAMFLALAPGFGVQYLAWLCPWVIALRTAPAIAFYAVTGAFLFAIYTDTAAALPWYFSDFILRPSMTKRTATLAMLSWISVLLVMMLYFTGRWRVAQSSLDHTESAT
ncbi:MAG TPA: glycosyltransferase 87 family protein [Bryobacteraceae bacterium]|nr:glycosyltransferase 87 family protein [Bryobacteraceae bacterium]